MWGWRWCEDGDGVVGMEVVCWGWRWDGGGVVGMEVV